ncbi:MAG: DMT family transporter [Alphaproteobacteria bacterium]|nr:DMT family transporter [Alphaproteobacteria bacterium]
MIRNKELCGILVAVGAALVFGFYPTATRAVYADGGNAVFIIIFTTFWRAMSMAAFCFATKRRLFSNKKDVRSAITNGLYQIISIIGILGGMAFIPGAMVIVIVFSYPLMLYLFLAFKGEERISLLTLLPIVVALLGLGLVLNVYNYFTGFNLIGVGLAFLAAVTAATRIYAYGQLLKDRDPAIVGAETFIFALCFCFITLSYNLPCAPTTTMGWVWGVVAAASLSAGNFGMFYGIGLLGSFKFSFFSKLEPVFAAVFSALFINEIMSVNQYIGMALVVGSLFVYQLLQGKNHRFPNENIVVE